MHHEDIIRAWKDEAFYASLDETSLAEMPAYPAGLRELSDEDLEAATGGDPIIISVVVSVAVSVAVSVVVSALVCDLD